VCISLNFLTNYNDHCDITCDFSYFCSVYYTCFGCGNKIIMYFMGMGLSSITFIVFVCTVVACHAYTVVIWRDISVTYYAKRGFWRFLILLRNLHIIFSVLRRFVSKFRKKIFVSPRPNSYSYIFWKRHMWKGNYIKHLFVCRHFMY